MKTPVEMKTGLTCTIIKEAVSKLPGVHTESVIPEGVKDPELLFRSVVKKLNGDKDAARSKMSAAETKAGKLKSRLDGVEFANEDLEKYQSDMSKELSTLTKRNGDIEMKIAFLGTQWERLSGTINWLILEDKDKKGAVAKVTSELLDEQSRVFDLDMANRKVKRLNKSAAGKLEFAENLSEKWGEELLEIRRADEDSDTKVAKLLTQIEALKVQILKTQDQFKASDSEASSLASKLTALQKQLVESQDTARGLDKTLIINSREAGLASKLVEEVGEDMDTTKVDKGDIREDLLVAKFEAKEKMEQVEVLRAKLEETEAQLDAKDKELRRVKADLSTSRQTYREAESRYSQTALALRNNRVEAEAAHDETLVLKGAIDSFAENAFDFKYKYVDSDELAKKLFNDLEATKGELSRTQLNVKNLEAVLASTWSELATSRVALKDVSRKGTRVQSQVRILEKGLLESADTAEQRAALIATLATDTQVLSREAAEKNAYVKKVEGEVAAAKDKLEVVRSRCSYFDAEYRKVKVDLATTRTELKASTKLVIRLEGDKKLQAVKARSAGCEFTAISNAHEVMFEQAKETQFQFRDEKALRQQQEVKLETLCDRLKRAEREARTVENARLVVVKDLAELRKSVKEVERHRFFFMAETIMAAKDAQGAANQMQVVKEGFVQMREDFNELKFEYQDEAVRAQKLEQELEKAKVHLSNLKEQVVFQTKWKDSLLEESKEMRCDITETAFKANKLSLERRFANADLLEQEVEKDFISEALFTKLTEFQRAEKHFRKAEISREQQETDLAAAKLELLKLQEALPAHVDFLKSLKPDLETTKARLQETEARAIERGNELRSLKEVLEAADIEAGLEADNTKKLLKEIKERDRAADDSGEIEQMTAFEKRALMAELKK